MDNPSSSLETLRQLREMLDAGTLTQAEFDALKAKLIFGNAPPGPPAPSAVPPAFPPHPPLDLGPPAPEPPPPPPALVGAAPGAAPASVSSLRSGAADEPGPSLAAGAAAVSASAEPGVPAASAAAPPGPPAAAASVCGLAGDADDYAPEPPAPRNYLNLVLALGGLLALLAVVLYLNLNPRDSEHLSSTSQTAADTLALPVDEGPQAEQPVRVESVPETIRVVPTNPAPPIVRPSLPARDSAGEMPVDSLP